MNASFRPPDTRPAPVLLWIVGLCALFEIAFTLAESPVFGFPALRRTAIMYGAFWPGLLQSWEPLFPGQRITMFITYAFLHSGLMHLVFNMLLLLHLGRESVARLGPAGFALVYGLCAVGGAVAFGLLNGGDTPMLGASGAVFGLFGATIYWDIQRRQALHGSLSQPIRLIVGLVIMNVLLWAMTGGMLAWETHLGGFVTGAVLARIITPSLGHGHQIGRRMR